MCGSQSLILKKKKIRKSKRLPKPVFENKEIAEFMYVAIKAKTLTELFNISSDWEEIYSKVGGEIKGFDDKNLAEHWLRQKPKKKKRKRI